MCQSKTCSKCKKEKPLSEYHNSKRNKKDGKTAACKDCERNRKQIAKRTVSKKSNPKLPKPRKIKQVTTEKKCKTCEKVKSLENFESNKEDCIKCVDIKDALLQYKKHKNKLNTRIKNFKLFCNIVDNKKGVCLDDFDKFVDNLSQLQVQCENKHTWMASFTSLNNNSWCPICTRSLYNGELICLSSCQFLFELPFVKIRPIWLLNEDGNRLELDMYNEDHKIAVEYNGEQHYKFIKKFHKTEEYFQKRCRDDQMKIKTCKELGIRLIIVPYTVKKGNICEFIYDRSIKLDLPVKKHFSDFKYDENFKYENTLQFMLNQIIKEKGGTLIEGIAVDNSSRITIQCDQGHTFDRGVKCIKSGLWCKKCFDASDEGKEKKEQTIALIKDHHTKQNEEARKDLTEIKCSYCHKVKPLSEYKTKKTMTATGYETRCNECKSINASEKHARNKEKHKGEYTCEFCDKVYENRRAYIDHIKNKHPDDYVKDNYTIKPLIPKQDVYKCHLCPKEYTQRGTYLKHIKEHNDTTIYQCEICNKILKNKKSLTTHIKSHDDTEYKCHICNKTMKYKSSLKKHLEKVHKNNQPNNTI